MHKMVSMKNQELSIVQPVDNHWLTNTERFKFFNQCKKTIRQKFDAVNLGMLFLFNCLSKKTNIYNFLSRFYENYESFYKFK